MPNWCSTDVRVSGPDVEAFDQFMEEAKKKPSMNTDFGKNWLGHPLLLAGMPKDEVVHGSINCRGRIEDKDTFDDGCMIYYCESAWGSCDDVFKYIKDKKNFDVEIDFFAVEPGCEVFVTSDYAFSEGQWYVSCDCNRDSKFAALMDGECVWWEKDLERALRKIYGSGNLEEMIERARQAEDEDPDVWISINKIELVE